MIVGQFPGALVLTGACQFGHGLGGFAINFIHSGFDGKPAARTHGTSKRRARTQRASTAPQRARSL